MFVLSTTRMDNIP